MKMMVETRPQRVSGQTETVTERSLSLISKEQIVKREKINEL